MVGANPKTTKVTTSTPTEIIPIRLNFQTGGYTYPTGATGITAQSKLFTNALFSSGNTQYGDAMMRASAWKYAAGSAYHTLLGAPVVKPLRTITVPASRGSLAQTQSGVIVGTADVNWFNSVISQIAATYPATSLPIFLSYDTVLYDGSLSNCCIGGYHSAIGQHTYVYGSFLQPQALDPTFSDLSPLSHEVAEWLFDPFVNNVTPNWSVPSQPQYGCSNSLETGDPVVGRNMTIAGHLYQDEVFLSWFARQTPSVGIGGRYTYLGTFRTVSPAC